MLAVTPSQVGNLADRLKATSFNTIFAEAVLDGDASGEIYVDSLERPEAVYVAHPYGMSLLFGETNDDHFLACLRDRLLNTHGVRKADEWLQVFPFDWSATLAELLGDRLISGNGGEGKRPAVIPHVRLNFAFDPERFALLELPPDPHGDRIVPMDGRMFTDFTGSVVPTLFWRDAAHFVQQGAGFVLERNGEMAATAFAAFMRSGRLEIGIETKPAFRGEGLAVRVCAALINHCLANGLEPVWACRGGNVGSIRLAEKLGFVQTLQLPYYQLVP